MNRIVTAVLEHRGYAFTISEAEWAYLLPTLRDFRDPGEFQQLRPRDAEAFPALQLPGTQASANTDIFSLASWIDSCRKFSQHLSEFASITGRHTDDHHQRSQVRHRHSASQRLTAAPSPCAYPNAKALR